MDELKDLLRLTRQEKGISLEEISGETKIQIRTLKALEEGDFSVFAGEVYIKGVLRSYARMVGLDPDETVELYNRLRHKELNKAVKEEKTLSEPRKEKPPKKPVNQQPAKPPPIKPVNQQPAKKPVKEGFLLIIFLVVVLLMGAGSIYFILNNQNRNNTDNNRIPQEEPRDGHNNGEDKDPEQPGEGGDLPGARVALVRSSSTEGFWEVAGDDELRLTIKLTGVCWISIRGQGITFRDRTLRQGETIELIGSDSIWVRLGNPRGVEVFINEVRIDEFLYSDVPVNLIFTLAN